MVVVAIGAGCPKQTPVAPPVVIEAAAATIETGADVAGAAGRPVTVIGTLARRRPDGASADGTAIVLADDTAVYVSEGEPPAGWAWMVGTRVRVQGTLWAKPETGWPVPTLVDAEVPMPADVSILLGD